MCKTFEKHGSESAGLMSPFAAYLDKKVHLTKFKGNRFNVIFYNAAAAYYHMDSFRSFLEVWGSGNLLLEAVKKDLESPVYVAGIRALGIVDKTRKGSCPICTFDEIMALFPCAWATVGLHPKYANQFGPDFQSRLVRMAQNDRVVAIGETGLDYTGVARSSGTVKQKAVFAAQCEIAKQLGLPVVIHCRNAEADCLQVAKQHLPLDHPIHLHCFTGSWVHAQGWLQHFTNLCIGVTGLVGRSSSVTTLARNLPLSRMLLETDAPYLLPVAAPAGSQFSHPGMVLAVAQEISNIRGTSVTEVCRHTTSNAVRLYKLPLY
ncbi:PREDICTED: putative deoxyribonuclease TATDN2 [Priapulus caudatus]|uniref:Deoxyribonuclease TATDN2 n=1 Tax=Priapulus caudatus TaxID=37621 RepID=A0ABM1E1S3_PRICU|nr:PREDICTED: putative deoxyribonuclease TATDN2 [Priapulus caudatus]